MDVLMRQVKFVLGRGREDDGKKKRGLGYPRSHEAGRIDHILYKFEGVPVDSMAGSIDWEAFPGLELTGPVMCGQVLGIPVVVIRQSGREALAQ